MPPRTAEKIHSASFESVRSVHPPSAPDQSHLTYPGSKLKLVNFAAAQHNTFLFSNLCKELDLARFYQRTFFGLCLAGAGAGTVLGGCVARTGRTANASRMAQKKWSDRPSRSADVDSPGPWTELRELAVGCDDVGSRHGGGVHAGVAALLLTSHRSAHETDQIVGVRHVVASVVVLVCDGKQINYTKSSLSVQVTLATALVHFKVEGDSPPNP